VDLETSSAHNEPATRTSRREEKTGDMKRGEEWRETGSKRRKL
jgi:hypothetical protein